MTDTGLLAVFLAGIGGLLAGRAWAAALRRGDAQERSGFRLSPHYSQALHYLAAGRGELAIGELNKAAREDPEAVDVLQVLGDLLRESGQVEKAIQVHQSILSRRDLTRGERSHVLACLGMDFRKAGFLDRAAQAFEEALAANAKNIHAVSGIQKLHEEQRQWNEAYAVETRLSRLRKAEDSLVLGYLQAEMGREAAAAGRRDVAERAFRTAISLHRGVFPAYLGLADLMIPEDPRRAAGVLEEAAQAAPERAYLTFDRLERAYAACGEASRFSTLCEKVIQQDPRDWRARLALARHLRALGQHREAYGLLLRAVEANPQVLLVHLETWRTLRDLGVSSPELERYVATTEESVFYVDPHICTVCRYRADDMLWRCPHCHQWNAFVEERLAPAAGAPR